MNTSSQNNQNSAIRDMFSKVSATYDLTNRILTLGLDVLWRRRAARLAAAGGGDRWADVCTGTGDMAVYLRRLAGPDTEVYAVDFCKEMLEKAKKKCRDKDITFTEANVTSLPFSDNILDLITGAAAVHKAVKTHG